MATPRIPGTDPDAVDLTCGERVPISHFDLGMREFSCACGSTHGVVMDVHPPERFLPPEVVDVLRHVVEPDDGGQFDTHHLLGLVLEEFPDRVIDANVADNGHIGCQSLWVSEFDSRRLHAVIVDLVLELMDHAMTHSKDEEARSTFASSLATFDVEEFVERYRDERDLEDVR